MINTPQQNFFILKKFYEKPAQPLLDNASPATQGE